MQTAQPQLNPDASFDSVLDDDIDRLLDDMDRADLDRLSTSARDAELQIAELRQRLAKQDQVIADLVKRLQPPPHGDPNARATADQKSAPAASPPQEQPPQLDPVIMAWAQSNPWFFQDEELHGAAIALEGAMLRKIPDTAKRLEKVKAELMRTFPAKFGNTAPVGASSVSRPGPQNAGRGKSKEPTLADLDDDARSALAAIKKVDPSFTDETYIRIWKTRRDERS